LKNVGNQTFDGSMILMTSFCSPGFIRFSVQSYAL